MTIESSAKEEKSLFAREGTSSLHSPGSKIPYKPLPFYYDSSGHCLPAPPTLEGLPEITQDSTVFQVSGLLLWLLVIMAVRFLPNRKPAVALQMEILSSKVLAVIAGRARQAVTKNLSLPALRLLVHTVTEQSYWFPFGRSN